MNQPANILLIYTGGTIGSFEDPDTRSLRPLDFEQLNAFIPELKKIEATIEVIAFSKPKDSSDIQPEDWVVLVEIIENNYQKFDGFVVLHGTDTMAYTASALSFMIENLQKPVIFTGSQLPIGKIRTDGKENLITAIEIASAKRSDGRAVVPEVCIYFEFKLYRANRTFKYSSHHFNAYQSPNYPYLAEAGVNIVYNESAIMQIPKEETRFYKTMDPAFAIFPLFPGFTRQVAENVIQQTGIKALILHTYGSGNGPIIPWFFELLREAQEKNIILLNITQCEQGAVEMGRYETSRTFRDLGICSGSDLTMEAAVTKLMFLLGRYPDQPEQVKSEIQRSLRGEMSL
jgi:L-asparaginase